LIELVMQRPASGSPVKLDVPYQVRRFQMRRFHYSVFTARVEHEVVVFAVSHHKRAPTYWTRRLHEAGG
jgi:hypothetical protein